MPSKQTGPHNMKERDQKEIKTEGGKLRLDDRLIKMWRKHLQLPRGSCHAEIIADDHGRSGCRWGPPIASKKLVIMSWKCDPTKGWLLCGLIEFTENARLQNEISPLFTVQCGSLDRMSRGPFLLIKGGMWTPGGGRLRAIKINSYKKKKKPLPSAPLSSGHKGRGDRSC